MAMAASHSHRLCKSWPKDQAAITSLGKEGRLQPIIAKISQETLTEMIDTLA
jgi:hypothetical protein